MIVTIDGPAGAGKSSAARELAARLGFQFLDTGAMYRAVTWVCLRDRLNLEDENAVAELARRIAIRFDGDRVFVDDVEVTREIRSTEVTHQTRHVAGNNAVRAHLVELQRRLAGEADVVTEGRDQGTVAFPHAECKFYITADPRERALRRQRDLAEQGEQVTLEDLLAEQTRRDERDESREFGALKPAPDAIRIDSSHRSLDEVAAHMERIVRERAAKNPR